MLHPDPVAPASPAAAPAPVSDETLVEPVPGLVRHELQSLTLAPVHAVGVRPLHAVDGATDVVSVVRLFRAERCTQVQIGRAHV